MFQHTAARRRLVPCSSPSKPYKSFQHTAARRRLGQYLFPALCTIACFNTQPPEGGWTVRRTGTALSSWFQHTAARRRLAPDQPHEAFRHCFNTQPPEGGWRRPHSAAAGRCSFNTQPPEGGWSVNATNLLSRKEFQHTAARRRLDKRVYVYYNTYKVSTHSRPKAAGFATSERLSEIRSFNTQPPEGGWP